MTAKKDFEKLIFDILNPLKEKYSKGYAKEIMSNF